MSNFITAEQRAAAERLYNIATRLQGIVMQKGESAGLGAHTMISAETEYQSFIKDLNLVTGMSFNAPESGAERGVRFGAMVASIDQLKQDNAQFLFHPMAHPKAMQKNKPDIIVRGEGEQVFLNFVKTVDDGTWACDRDAARSPRVSEVVNVRR